MMKSIKYIYELYFASAPHFPQNFRDPECDKTAEELHLTQPAVSIQLKNFQQQFPMDLTEVVGRQLYLTDFGKDIAQLSARILEEVDSIDHRIKSFGGQLAGRLKLQWFLQGSM